MGKLAPLAASALLTGLTLVSAGAQELVVDQTKLYVSDPAACEPLEQKGADAFMDMDFLTLSFDKGIQSMEFHCNFFDVKSRPYNSHLFVSAVCEAPGEVYPDTLSISAYDEKTIQVVSSYDAMMVVSGAFEPPGPTTNPGVTMYHRCDNLSEIPVD
jgi:hypothetical protein